jgi:flavin reductase (DIM6/NTAB) family NADH-FMN oxidoreductase RutF
MSISSDEFRDCLRLFPAGVTIITIKTAKGVHGLTVSAFASVSPSPPLIMIIIDQKHTAYTMLQEAGTTFAVNILGQDQIDLSERFAWTKSEDRFEMGEWGTAITGAPILKDSLAWLDCTIHSSLDAGTHTIYVGQVQASSAPRPDQPPLIYWNRAYRKLEKDQ